MEIPASEGYLGIMPHLHLDREQLLLETAMSQQCPLTTTHTHYKPFKPTCGAPETQPTLYQPQFSPITLMVTLYLIICAFYH